MKTWAASPFPSSIGLYKSGQGYPTFDKKQSEDYFKRVNKRVKNTITDIIDKWNLAGLYRD